MADVSAEKLIYHRYEVVRKRDLSFALAGSLSPRKKERVCDRNGGSVNCVLAKREMMLSKKNHII